MTNRLLTPEDLRKSILQIGVLQPLIWLDDQLLDGRKRQRICEEEGIDPPERRFYDPKDCAPVLWRIEPERCARIFPCSSIVEAAELYACDLGSVAHLFRRPPPRKPDREYWKKANARRSKSHVTLRLPKALWDQLRADAKRLGWPRSHLVEVALMFAVDRQREVVDYSADCERPRRGQQAKR